MLWYMGRYRLLKMIIIYFGSMHITLNLSNVCGNCDGVF